MIDPDFDVKITLGSTTRKLKLLRQRGGKAWAVREEPLMVGPGVGDTREGSGVNRLPFTMSDWSWGIGLDRFGHRSQPGHTLRIADGYNIDTSDPGYIKHGPLGANIGTVQGTGALKFVMFGDKVWIISPQRVYTYNGTTLSEFEDLNATQSITALTDIFVFGSNIYVCADSAKYFVSDGSAAFSEVKDGTTSLPTDYFLALGQRAYRAYSTNLLAYTSDPSDGTAWNTVITIGHGDAITALFSLVGLPLVGTQSTIYIVDDDDEPRELNSILRTRRGANAFSIQSNSGSDVWLSDGKDVTRIVPLDFEVFNIGPEGPFLNLDERPYNVAIPGDITSICQDVEAVYVCVASGTDTLIYKGKALTRDLFAWSPLVKVAGANAASGVFKLSGDSTAFLYAGIGTSIIKYALPWSTYASDWEVVLPYFTADLDAWDKMWHTLRTYLENSDITKCKVTAYYRLDGDTDWTSFGTTGEMAADGLNKIALTTPLTGKRVQLKLVGATADSTKKVDVRSIDLRGIARADHARILDFVVVVDNKAAADFIWSLRTDTTQFITIEDRFGTSRTVFVHPGYPVEQELYDEAGKRPTRAYHIVAEEVV